MHIDDVRRHQAEKDHLMRHEGKHPANEVDFRMSDRSDEDKMRDSDNMVYEQDEADKDRIPMVRNTSRRRNPESEVI